MTTITKWVLLCIVLILALNSCQANAVAAWAEIKATIVTLILVIVALVALAYWVDN